MSRQADSTAVLKLSHGNSVVNDKAFGNVAALGQLAAQGYGTRT